MRVDIQLWWRSGGDSTLGKAKRLQDEAGQREPPDKEQQQEGREQS